MYIQYFIHSASFSLYSAGGFNYLRCVFGQSETKHIFIYDFFYGHSLNFRSVQTRPRLKNPRRLGAGFQQIDQHKGEAVEKKESESLAGTVKRSENKFELNILIHSRYFL